MIVIFILSAISSFLGAATFQLEGRCSSNCQLINLVVYEGSPILTASTGILLMREKTLEVIFFNPQMSLIGINIEQALLDMLIILLYLIVFQNALYTHQYQISGQSATQFYFFILSLFFYQYILMDPQPKLKNILYLIAVHFQATCEQNKQLKPCQELIQFNAIVFSIKDQDTKIIGRFHEFVKPKCNPKLSQFCSAITGIKNEELKNCKQIEEILKLFQKWIVQLKVLVPENYTFLTWGSWPLKKLLPSEIKTKKIRYPEYLHSFTDLKRIYNSQIIEGNIGIPQALKQMKIDIEKQVNTEKLTKSQYIVQGLAQLAIKLYKQKRFSPGRKSITVLHDIPNVNVTQNLQYLLVLDFEATCEDNVKLKPCSEIIQFPVMIIDLKAKKIIGQFHEYVLPEYNPKLTKFCTELTGITQQMVDNKPSIKQVLEKLENWMSKQINLHSKNFTFVTCGDWDLASCLKNQAKTKNLVVPDYLKNYINVKKVFLQAMPNYQKSMGMMGMLGGLKIQHQGRHHSGIDDVRNICNICIGLMDKGLKFSKKHISYVK